MLALAIAPLSFTAPLMAPRAPAAAASSVQMGVADMEGSGPETGGKVWDPLNLAGMGGEKTIAW